MCVYKYFLNFIEKKNFRETPGSSHVPCVYIDDTTASKKLNFPIQSGVINNNIIVNWRACCLSGELACAAAPHRATPHRAGRARRIIKWSFIITFTVICKAFSIIIFITSMIY